MGIYPTHCHFRKSLDLLESDTERALARPVHWRALVSRNDPLTSNQELRMDAKTILEFVKIAVLLADLIVRLRQR
jgi:hypothetical protein